MAEAVSLGGLTVPVSIVALIGRSSGVLSIPSVRTTLLVHITAGGLAIVLGFVALYAAKGAKLHRRSGMLFVYAVLTMAVTGAVIAAVEGVKTSVIAALLTAYLAITALIAVRPATGRWRWLSLGAMLVAFAIGLTSIALAIPSIANGKAPNPILFVFGTVALLASVADLRMIRSGGVRGASRLARHLWRMCFALWIASASFFLGQAGKFPEKLRIPLLLAIPVLVPLVVMFYWLWRVRIRRAFPRPTY